MGSGMGSNPRLLSTAITFTKEVFGSEYSFKEKRSRRRKWWWWWKKIMVK